MVITQQHGDLSCQQGKKKTSRCCINCRIHISYISFCLYNRLNCCQWQPDFDKHYREMKMRWHQFRWGCVKSMFYGQAALLLRKRCFFLNAQKLHFLLESKVKSVKCLSISKWLKDLLFILKLVKLKYTLRGPIQTFYYEWQAVISDFINFLVLPD